MFERPRHTAMDIRAYYNIFHEINYSQRRLLPLRYIMLRPYYFETLRAAAVNSVQDLTISFRGVGKFRYPKAGSTI